MLYTKIFTHKLLDDLEDVRDYIESGMMIAAITRINLIKKDIVKSFDAFKELEQIRLNAVPKKKF